MDQVPPALATEYDRYLRKLTPRRDEKQRKASEDVTTFALYMGKRR